MGFLNRHKIGAPHGITILGVLLAWLLAVPAPCGAGDPFSLSANGNYRKNGGDNVETSDRFNHSYNLTFDKQLSSMMDVSTAARYNETFASEGNDSSSLNPSAALDLRNDLFFLNLSASDSWIDTENSALFYNKTWGANLYSQLEKWPHLRLSYNQSSSEDDEDVHEQDSTSSNWGASVDYAVAGLNLLYDFRYGTSDDYVTDTTTDTLNHYAQVKYSESFFRNRLSIAASQQYSSNSTELDGPVGADGVFTLRVPATAGLSKTAGFPRVGALTNNPALIDGDRTAPANVQVVGAGDIQHVGVEVDLQEVDQVRIYFDRIITSTGLQWELYRSNNNSDWTAVSLSSLPGISTLSGNTVVTFDFSPINARYLKVVIDPDNWPSGSSVEVTEIEAYLRTDESTNDFVSHQTQVGISYRPTANWVAGYSFRRVLNLPDSGLDNIQMTHSANASYTPSVYFGLALGASVNSDDIDESEDSLSRSYSVAITSAPLPTLDTSLGYTRTYDYEDDEETSRNDIINGTLAAEIFPDLTASFSPFWSRNQELDSAAKTTTHGFTLNSNARLTPRLDLTGYWNYARSDAETEEEKEEAFATMTRQYGATLSYRPSDVLLVSGGLQRDQEEDATSLLGTMTWLVTRNIQANGGVAVGLGEDDPNQYNASVHWMLSRNLSLQGGGNYQDAEDEEEDTWGMSTSLNINY